MTVRGASGVQLAKHEKGKIYESTRQKTQMGLVSLTPIEYNSRSELDEIPESNPDVLNGKNIRSHLTWSIVNPTWQSKVCQMTTGLHSIGGYI